MKIKWLSVLLLTLLLVACGAGEDGLASEETVNSIYTQVALTLSAQPAPATATSMPTFTAFPTLASVLLNPATVTPSYSPVSLSSAGSSAVGCDNSAYLSDVTIPDGTVLTPASTFTKTWSLQNTGSCDWTTSYSIVFYSGNAMSGVTTTLSESVAVGSSGEISVALTAPSAAGSYTGYWRLQNASGTSFGEAVYVQIVVSGSTSTETITSTPTSTTEVEESTATPTNTPEPTATETPSS